MLTCSLHFDKTDQEVLEPQKKVRLSSWHEIEDSQIGQLMYYLMLAQLKSLVQIPLAAPHLILGLFTLLGGHVFWHIIVSLLHVTR